MIASLKWSFEVLAMTYDNDEDSLVSLSKLD